ncbi:TetR/AcrR family transcriptional regulator [Nocardioides sp. WS12]|uniref:TetR/AcrR family transcriptional regulator n=1 Tax=Nocardioides sp. WS12 TaxID=2486272 RepID=UPI0015F95AA7|nr:TetR/AcrR family transcriptional regulator [Nocardioides sp. WS12]
MSTAYEKSGRTRQKARTRGELIAATRALIASGTPSPTVEEAAERASVSRTTAYRYFPSQTALLIAAHPEITTTSLLSDDAGDDPATRLDQAVERFLAMVLEGEGQQRTMLRLSLEASDKRDLPLRQGRAIGWFTDALAPLEPRLGKAEVRRLAVAIRSATGIEALVWLTDVAGLSRPKAAQQLRWTAQAMLAHALTEGPP